MTSPEAVPAATGVRRADLRTGAIAALGEPALLAGFRLAGAVLYPATAPAEVRRAWTQLPETVAAVLLTPAAAAVLTTELTDPASPLTVVLP
jgi:vacuolar-type H+-ATPase subunit F/Vma7